MMVLCYLMINIIILLKVGRFDPTNFEMDQNYVLVDHEKLVLSDRYIVEFVHDATENYYERGKYGCRNSHVTKTPIFMLFYLPMLNALCFMDLFSYKMKGRSMGNNFFSYAYKTE